MTHALALGRVTGGWALVHRLSHVGRVFDALVRRRRRAVHVRMTRGTAKSAAITRRTTTANIIKISYPGMMAPFRRVLAPK